MIKKGLVLLTAMLMLTACGAKNNPDDMKLKVASHMMPMTDVVEIAKEELKKDGYELELVSVSDNTQANTALNNKEIDANFFQHVPFMEMFNKSQSGTLVGIQPIYDAIVGFYSKDLKDIKDLKDDAKIAIPNDAVNQARALLILQDAGLITLKDGVKYDATIKDVTDHKNYQFIEVDLLTLNQAYEEVDLVFNYPTYIKQVGLTPSDALILEKSDGHYAISLVAREDNKDDAKIQALKKAMTSDAVRKFLTEEHSATLSPAF